MTAQARLVVELAVGAVFLLAFASKLPHPWRFALGAADYEVLPRPLALAFGVLLIPMEGFVAASHLSGWRLGWGALLGLALLAAFAVAVAVNLRRGRGLPCHCLDGRGDETLSARSLARLVLLLAGELFLVCDPELLARPDRLVHPEQAATLPDLGLAALWATGVLLAASWLLRADEIAALRRTGCATCGMEAPAIPGQGGH
jgi:Methylamine utilisation protein MauE